MYASSLKPVSRPFLLCKGKGNAQCKCIGNSLHGNETSMLCVMINILVSSYQVGESALMYACKMRDLDTVKMIRERKANLNAVTVV